MRSSNPHTGDYEEAREAFHRLDETLAAWMADNVRARIAEFDSDSERACEMLREAGELLLRGCEQYAVAREEVRGVILSTPRMNGQDLTEDERVHGWARLARELLDGGVVAPGLTPNGQWKAENNGRA